MTTVAADSINSYEQGLPPTAGETVGAVPVVQSDGTFGYESVVTIPGSPEVYTKTYNTPARTIPAATAVAPNTQTGAYVQADAQSVVTQVNALEADVLALRKLIVALVTDLEAAGIVG